MLVSPRLKIFLLSLFAIAALAYVGALVYLALDQRKLQYFPTVMEVSPQAAGLAKAKVLHLKTSDGESLLAWHIAPAPGRPLIVYFAGNADGLDNRAERFAALTGGGIGLLAIEYRGWAGSSGTPSEAGLDLDAEAAYAKALELGDASDKLIFMGESLGTGVAVSLAARHHPSALVLDSPFSSAVDVAAQRYPIFPVRWLMRDQYRSDLRIGDIQTPVLMAHGEADRVVPIEFGERLFALAHEPKDFIRVPGEGHLALGKVIPSVLQWIDAHVK